MSKYLELVEGSFTQEHLDKQTSQNPYVAYSIEDDKVIYSIKQESLYQMIDLGLPSGLKWADRNVGASSPEDAGLYFQWGDTIGYTADQVGKDKVFDWNSYFDVSRDENGNPLIDEYGFPISFEKYNNNDGLTTLKPEDDAAYTHMGSQYRMPTYTEIQELIDYTTHTFIDVEGNEFSQEEIQNGVIEEGKLKSVRFTGSNGNSIFIPAAGICDGVMLCYNGAWGRYGSSSLFSTYGGNSRGLYFSYDGNLVAGGNGRLFGVNIRGIQA